MHTLCRYCFSLYYYQYQQHSCCCTTYATSSFCPTDQFSVINTGYTMQNLRTDAVRTAINTNHC